MTKARVSTTGIATTSPITLYANSPENTDLSPNFKVVIPGNSVGPMYLSSGDQSTDEVENDGEINITIPNPDDDTESGSNTSTGTSYSFVPSTSDITVVSNSVVYSSIGTPSVTLALKIKNSSGTKLKGVNVRVQSL